MTAMIRGAAVAVAWLVWTVAATAQVQFSIADTEACLVGAENSARMQCVGKGAKSCMNSTTDGGTTYGMTLCLSEEHDYWDARLNAAYSALRTVNTTADAEMKEIGSTAPEQAPALQKMQRAWIAYRDASCKYERSWWGGGTGAGPAGVDCVLKLTAQQALYLEDALSWGN